ncbi:MAG: hypothetical protein VB022_04200 [Rikenellaceae bacterium]|nr:hypothetical protein [Rikenellaceae bacterium]
MKITLLITGLILIGGLIYFLASCKGQSTKTNDKQTDSDTGQVKTHDLKENPYDGLRQMAFGVTTEQLGLKDLKADDIYGVIMDWDLGEGIMTLITYKTGDASMYLSTGGGVFGGGQHENVNKASKQFVKLADKYLDKTVKTDLTPIPDKNCVRFYFLTIKGKYYAQEQMINFENRTSQWMDYFDEANKVITELRLTTEKE